MPLPRTCFPITGLRKINFNINGYLQENILWACQTGLTKNIADLSPFRGRPVRPRRPGEDGLVFSSRRTCLPSLTIPYCMVCVIPVRLQRRRPATPAITKSCARVSVPAGAVPVNRDRPLRNMQIAAVATAACLSRKTGAGGCAGRERGCTLMPCA